MLKFVFIGRVMAEELTYFCNTSDLSKITGEHPEYTKIYACFKTVDDKKISDNQGTFKRKKTVLSLSKNHGDFLYLVSNVNHDNVKDYFSISKPVFEKTEPTKNKTVLEPVKRTKQQTLESFFKKSK